MTPCPICKDTGVIEQEDTHDTDIYPCRCQEEEMSEDRSVRLDYGSAVTIAAIIDQLCDKLFGAENDASERDAARRMRSAIAESENATPATPATQRAQDGREVEPYELIAETLRLNTDCTMSYDAAGDILDALRDAGYRIGPAAQFAPDGREVSITSEVPPMSPNPERDALAALIARAKRAWSRDDYGTETQDEYVADEIMHAGYRIVPAADPETIAVTISRATAEQARQAFTLSQAVLDSLGGTQPDRRAADGFRIHIDRAEAELIAALQQREEGARR